jgi:hypothetical protein
MWVATVFYIHYRTGHQAPDYSDTLRLIEIFVIPWESGEPKFPLLVSEYEALGHSAILLKAAILVSGVGGSFDFSIPGTLGRMAHVAMLIGTFSFIGLMATRERFALAWWAGAGCVLAWMRPDSLVDIANNLIAFEWIYLAAAAGYLMVLARFLNGETGWRPPVVVGVAVAFVGSAAGATALLAGVGLTAWWALRTRTVHWPMATCLVPIVASFVINAVLMPWRQVEPTSVTLEGLDPVAAGVWMLKAMSQSALHLDATEWERFEGMLPFSMSRAVVFVILGLIVGVGSIWVASRVRVSTTSTMLVGLMGFGALAAIGAYVTRSALVGPNGVLEIRYVRLMTPLLAGLVGLAILHLGERGPRYRQICVGAALAGLIVVRIFVISSPDPIIRHYEYIEGRYSAYEAGTFQELPEQVKDFFLAQFWPPHAADQEIVSRVLDWQAENIDYEP